MTGYLIRRVLWIIPVLFAISLITFSLMHAVPGGPWDREKPLPRSVVERLNAEYGLDDPLPVQYLRWAGGLVTGDLGPSYRYRDRTVNDIVGDGLGTTAQLGIMAFLLAVVTSEPLIGLLKSVYDRPRPVGGLLATHSASFPSGHAVAGAVTAVGIVIVLLPPGPRRWRWEVQAAAFAGLMALSRTYLGVHWLSDVVAGTLLGITLAVGWPALLQEVRERRQARTSHVGTASPTVDLAAEGL